MDIMVPKTVYMCVFVVIMENDHRFVKNSKINIYKIYVAQTYWNEYIKYWMHGRAYWVNTHKIMIAFFSSFIVVHNVLGACAL